MASLVRTLDEHGATNDRVACEVGGERATYPELAGRVRRIAAGLLDAGLRPGDRVSLYLPNSVDYVSAFYGVMRAGLVANPVNSVLTPAEVRHLLADSGAAALISTPELLDGLGEVLAEVGSTLTVSTADQPRDGGTTLADLLATDDRTLPYPPDDAPACLPYSSGTTGRAKGIVHTHDSLAMQAILSANHLQMRPGDVLVQGLPLVHLYPGNIIMGGLVVAGATMVAQQRFDPREFVQLLASHRATACAGVPTTYALLCQLPPTTVAELDLRPLQVAYCAGAPLPSRIRSDFHRMYGTPVLDCYGITEAAGNLTATLRYGTTPALSCGVPYPFTEIRIVDDEDHDVEPGDVGQLLARGPQIMSGYWNRPADTEDALRGGWLHTGDLAHRDENGFVYIVDRLKDMIVTGGYNVYPAEVEDVLQSHPDVAMCAVFAVDDPVKGEKPWAAVVPGEGRALDPAALDEHCRARLAHYKVPRRFLVTDDLPRSSVGKVLRRELRRLHTSDDHETARS